MISRPIHLGEQSHRTASWQRSRNRTAGRSTKTLPHVGTVLKRLCRSEMEESDKVIAVAFVADGQAPIPGEPGVGAFDLPPVSTGPLVPVDATSGDAPNNALCPRSDPAVLVAVLVGLERAGFAAARTTPETHRRNRATRAYVLGIRLEHHPRLHQTRPRSPQDSPPRRVSDGVTPYLRR